MDSKSKEENQAAESQIDWGVFIVPSMYGGKHNLYTLAQEIMTSMDAKLVAIETSIQILQKEIQTLKDAVQGASTMSIHVMHELAHINSEQEQLIGFQSSGGKRRKKDINQDTGIVNNRACI
eukprot:Gb_29419 [translate_table: standard]